MQSKLTATLDSAFLFDVLAIFNVKLNKLSGQNKDKSLQNFKELADQIKSQIGRAEFDKIISSDEYKNLYDCNAHVFNLVDIANKDNGLAGEVARANTERFHLKNKLQSKFFGRETDEVKV